MCTTACCQEQEQVSYETEEMRANAEVKRMQNEMDENPNKWV